MPNPLRWLGLLAAALSLLAWPAAAPAAPVGEAPTLAAPCPPALLLGVVFDCELGAAGERDSFTLEGAHDERVVVRMLLRGGTLYPHALIRDGGGQPVAGCGANGATSATFVCALPAAGSYTLDFGDFYGVNTGSYAFYVQRLGSPGNTRDLLYGQPASAGLASSIASDVYRISAASGERVLLRLRRAGGSFLPTLAVLDQAGREVCTANSPSLVSITCALGGAGAYSVMVNDYHLSATGEYVLLAERLGSPADAQAIALGQRYSGAIGASSPSGKYSFAARRGDRVLLRALRRSGDLAISLRLYDGDGDLVCADESSPLALLDSCAIVEDGVHTAFVDDRSMLGTGQFTLFTQSLNNPGQFRFISFGQTVPAVLNQAGGFDTYTFVGEARDAVALTIRRSAGSMAPRVRVFGPSGALVCAAEGASAARTDGCALRESGRHTVIVDDAQTRATGDYSLTLTCLGGSCIGGAPWLVFLPMARR